ncbi:hypothetical protein DRQ33_00890 [bacterium]|nr:MAG: hypothetical protein DRQ33_00890 [bacterium]
MRRIGILIILSVGFISVWAQGAPTLNPLSEYTGGYTCQISWTIPDTAEPYVYHIQVLRVDSGETTFPDSLDNMYSDSIFSIFPIPISSVPGNSFTVGLDSTSTLADDPLVDGARYCYRVRYKYSPSEGEYLFSEWSNVECSWQDNSPPVVGVEPLNIWTNTTSATVNCSLYDDISDRIASAKLYYRTDSTSEWEFYSERTESGTGVVHIDFVFDSEEDGYYEFYVVGVDELGNQTSLFAGIDPAPKHTWTRFDTEEPVASLEPDDFEEYYTVRSIDLPFSASDTYSGVKRVEIYYRRDGGAPALFDEHIYTGLLDLTALDTFTTSHDGIFELYLTATDSADNVESSTDAEVSFNVDTRAPQFDATNAVDTTTVSHRYDVPAEANYSNDVSIFVEPETAVDNPPAGDTYSSQIESVYIAQSAAFGVNLQVFPYSAGENYLYEMTTGDETKEIFVKLKDFAGNFSTVKSQDVILDTDAPTMRSITIFDLTASVPTDTTDSVQVKVHIDPHPDSSPYYKIFLTQDISELDNIPSEGWQDIDDTLLFTFEDVVESGWVYVYAVLKDSAGNVSEEVSDSIYYNANQLKYVNLLSICDFDGPDTTGTYTDTTKIIVRVSYGRDIDSIAIWDDRGSPIYYSVPTPAAAETTDTIIHTFEPGDGTRWIYARGKCILDPIPTATESLGIILDTRNPILPSLVVRDASTGYDPTDTSEVSDSAYTNSPTVEVEFNGPYDPVGPVGSGIYHFKLTCSGTELEVGYSDITTFNLPDTDAVRNVNGYVQDSAGNWSASFTHQITLDRYRPTITSVVLQDSASGDENYTSDLTVRVVTVAEDGSMGNPAYIAFFEDADDWPQNLDEHWQDYNSQLYYTFVDTETGYKTLYIAVKDRAGNISLIASDQIQYGTSIICNFSLYDTDRGTDYTVYTNSRTVGVEFNPVGTPPADYFLSEDSSATYDWRPYPSTGMTTFTVSTGEGEKVVYGWLRSVSHIISPQASATIILDRTQPDLPQSFNLWDTTSQEIWPTTFYAHMGWSNDIYVYSSIPQAYDTLSGVESLHFLGPFIHDLWADRPYVPIEGGIMVTYPNDSVELILDGTEGSFDIIGGAMDVAGNWNDIIVHGGYDTIAPTLEIRPFTHDDPTTLPATIPMSITDDPDGGHLWKVCFKISAPETIVCAEYSEEWGDYPDFDVDFPGAEFLSPDTLYFIEIVAVDSAGNPSNLVTWIPGKMEYFVVDPHDTLDSEFTGTDTVLTVVNADVEPDFMRFASDSSNLMDQEWKEFSPIDTFLFGNARNEMKYVYAQFKFGEYETPVILDTIFLDTIPPSVDRVDAFDQETDDPNWSSSQTVKIVATNPQDTPPGEVYAFKVSESPNFDYNVRMVLMDENNSGLYQVADIPYQPTSDDPQELWDVLHSGARMLYVQVLDRAENPAPTKNTSIVVDWDPAKVINFPNPFNPQQRETFIRVKAKSPGATVEINIYDMFGNPVWNTTYTLKSDSREADIPWDGKNSNGDIVGNGGYICVVDFGDEVVKRKIAVWKGE